MCARRCRNLSPEHRQRGEKPGVGWAKKIYEDINKRDPHGHIVFNVHGFNIDATDALQYHRMFRKSLEKEGLENAVMVGYSWPSLGGSIANTFNYPEDRLDAQESAPELVRSGITILARMAQLDCRLKVHVIAHSLGCFAVREALRTARPCPSIQPGKWEINNLMLYAADISARSLHRSGRGIF